MINACKLTGRSLSDLEVITCGAGAAGIAITKLLMKMGLKNVILADRKGAIYEGRDGLNTEKAEMAKISNRLMKKGSLAEIMKAPTSSSVFPVQIS